MSKKSVKASILGKRRREQAAEQSGDVNRRGTGKAQPRTTNDRQAAACGLKLRSQLHRQCVAIVAKLLAAQATKRAGCTVKGLCLAPHVQSKKAVYAVVCETMRYQPVLQQIVDASSFREAHPEFSNACCLVMLYDLLLGQGIRPHSGPERTFSAHAERFRSCASRQLQAHSVATLADLLPARSRPQTRKGSETRHVRVNTLAATVGHVVAMLAQPPNEWPEHHRAPLFAQRDAHLPDVLVVAAPQGLHDHPLVEAGAVILQSKASCMPAHALQPGAGWHVVDCCAAPGNKTTHVAALTGERGRVSAFERDAKRCKTLKGTLDRARVEHAEVYQQDFMTVDPSDAKWRDVRAVLLDPSCSGSGTAAARLDFHDAPAAVEGAGATAVANPESPVKEAQQEEVRTAMLPETKAAQATARTCAFPGATSCGSERVSKLANFQVSILQHALQFPRLEKIVYSTCSVHREENEDVVAAVLPLATKLGFSLVQTLPRWPRRGLAGVHEWAGKVVRVHPELDGTDGFFVALFERVSGGVAKSESQ